MKRALATCLFCLISIAAFGGIGDPTPDKVASAIEKYPKEDRDYYAEKWQQAFDKTTHDLRAIARMRVKNDADRRRFEAGKVVRKRIAITRDWPITQQEREGWDRIEEGFRENDRRCDDMEKAVNKLRESYLKNDPIYIPPLSPADFLPGRVGQITSVRLLDIINHNTIRARLSGRVGVGQIVVITNLPDTQKLKKNELVELHRGIVKVLGERDEVWAFAIHDSSRPFPEPETKD